LVVSSRRSTSADITTIRSEIDLQAEWDERRILIFLYAVSAIQCGWVETTRRRLFSGHCLTLTSCKQGIYIQLRLSIIYNHPNQACLQWCNATKQSETQGTAMLWTLFVVLLVLWLLGVVSSYTLGGFIHILLVLAVIALVFQLLAGRRSAI
jgi:Family of unknown function (DUF5670)